MSDGGADHEASVLSHQCDPASLYRNQQLERIPAPADELILIALSVVLTMFTGLIPSRSTAKKDPVAAARSE